MECLHWSTLTVRSEEGGCETFFPILERFCDLMVRYVNTSQYFKSFLLERFSFKNKNDQNFRSYDSM